MGSPTRISANLWAALPAGSFLTAITFWASTSLIAQTPTGASAPEAGSIVVTEVPFHVEWASSPHAQKGSVPFTYGDNKKGDIPVACAGCHSSDGFLDLLGADGSAAGKVDRSALRINPQFCFHGPSRPVRHVHMTISLAFIAPALVKAAIEGRLPRGIGVAALREAPAEWSLQFKRLGLAHT